MLNTTINSPDVIIGRNAVSEALRAGQNIDTILVSGGGGSIGLIMALAKERGVVVKQVSGSKLDSVCGGTHHQGVVAYIAQACYAEMEDITARAIEREEDLFVVVCDGIEDPHNLGAVIRTAECAGVHGVIIPKRGGASLTPAAIKASSGAVSHIPVVRVPNITAAIEKLKSMNVWVYGADMSGTDYRQADYSGAIALVVGNEGKGISRLVKEKCDFLIKIPMHGNISSLNVSVASGIIMFEMRSAHE
ncbi:MAG: 23S rRNA (guanosine(2251)-2'-O)-methyltransferase RlmB [Oscillospiraceae bacterium]|nr:23S rRNA (guanosine(2251)-2'-O)-methyltransferase RlmB [Oscillospiraceae bacterium]